MAWFEQIPVTGENNAERNWKETEKKIITDANVVTDEDEKKTENWWDTVQTDPERTERNSETNSEMSEEEAKNVSDEILGARELRDQIDQLKNLWEKYKNWELKDIQQKQYEDLMTTIRTELDRDIPTVIEMNKEIDINYYNTHPTEAANAAEKIINDYQNMNDAQLVSNVINRSEYLWRDSKEKLYTVIRDVIKDLDENVKPVLKKQSRDIRSQKSFKKAA